jgi:hypothetical protein
MPGFDLRWAQGMRHYGFAAEATAVAHDVSGAATHFLLDLD